jgi:hypothetical protein
VTAGCASSAGMDVQVRADSAFCPWLVKELG